MYQLSRQQELNKLQLIDANHPIDSQFFLGYLLALLPPYEDLSQLGSLVSQIDMIMEMSEGESAITKENIREILMLCSQHIRRQHNLKIVIDTIQKSLNNILVNHGILPSQLIKKTQSQQQQNMTINTYKQPPTIVTAPTTTTATAATTTTTTASQRSQQPRYYYDINVLSKMPQTHTTKRYVPTNQGKYVNYQPNYMRKEPIDEPDLTMRVQLAKQRSQRGTKQINKLLNFSLEKQEKPNHSFKQELYTKKVKRIQLQNKKERQKEKNDQNDPTPNPYDYQTPSQNTMKKLSLRQQPIGLHRVGRDMQENIKLETNQAKVNNTKYYKEESHYEVPYIRLAQRKVEIPIQRAQIVSLSSFVPEGSQRVVQVPQFISKASQNSQNYESDERIQYQQLPQLPQPSQLLQPTKLPQPSQPTQLPSRPSNPFLSMPQLIPIPPQPQFSPPPRRPLSIQLPPSLLLTQPKPQLPSYSHNPPNPQPSKLNLSCPICLQQIIPITLCMLSCDDSFHLNCFTQYCKVKIHQMNFPLICPNQQCVKSIQNQDLNEFLPIQLKDKFYDFTFKHYIAQNQASTSWCPSIGCNAVFEFANGQKTYSCPSCNKNYCLQCQSQAHQHLTCQQFQQTRQLSEQDRKFITFVKGAKCKQCPSCRFWVQKNQGCDHMTCRCSYQFCYLCGRQYGTCHCGEDYDQQQEDYRLEPEDLGEERQDRGGEHWPRMQFHRLMHGLRSTQISQIPYNQEQE